MGSEGRAILWILIGFAAILVAASLSWFFENFERRDREIDTGYSAAARRNPFLAAERFLARLDMEVESISGRDRLRDLPPSSDTLVVNALGVLNWERRDALHRWIERGGHLVVEAEAPWDETKLLDGHTEDFLDFYGVRLRETENPPEEFDPDEEVLAAITIGDYRLEVGFTGRFYLEDASGEGSISAARRHVVAAGHPRLLQYDVGDGTLTVTSDNTFLTNRHLGSHDHAFFLALLVAPPDGGKVWLLYDSGMPWLGALLWQRAPFAMISGSGLLVLGIWYLGGRLGPLLPRSAGNRRDLLAHLQASGIFLWTHGQGGWLTKSSGEYIAQAWLRHHPALRGLDKSARAAWIAARAHLAPSDVERVLYPTAVHEGELVADTVLLQRLWSSLSAPGAAAPAPRRAVLHPPPVELQG
ncbi:MAG: DUF4350 domain-containing protein [Chromatiaceae bacterium]|nr:DUF4350 domain-containing protein [Chromatiaceae bacterium]